MSVSESLQALATSVFGIDNVRPDQQEAICKIVNGASVFVQLPAGQGKSLVYQCSGLLKKGITLVVLPLLALMQDQLHALHQRGICAMSLDEVFAEASKSVHGSRCGHGIPAFWYATPESVLAYRDRILSSPSSTLLKLIVFDEVHCLHFLGSKFRPSYLTCAQWLRFEFPQVPVVALTATATPSTLRGIEEALMWRPEKYEVVQRPSLRLNLRLAVVLRRSKYGDEKYFDEVSDLVMQMTGTGIVYCNSREETDSMATALQGRGLQCASYHAGQDSATRTEAQEAWMRGDCGVMCCNVAFGMGIDKPDVRFVIHTCLPSSIERYAQEIGRAGRDNGISRCVLMYNSDDALKVRNMWMDQHTPADLRNIDIMQTLVEDSVHCRHVLLSRLLGETLDAKKCGNACDNCERGQSFTLRNLEKFASSVVALVPFLLQCGLTRRSEMMPVFRGRIRAATRNSLFNGRFPAADLLYLKLEQEASKEEEETIERVLVKLFACGVLKENGPGRSVMSYEDRWSCVKADFCHVPAWPTLQPSKAVTQKRKKRAAAENEDQHAPIQQATRDKSAPNANGESPSVEQTTASGTHSDGLPCRKKARKQRVCQNKET